MLLGISPLLSPDLLHLLAAMGHGDEIALVDANFPAASTARRSGARLITLPGVDTPTLAAAVLRLLPLDRSVASPARVMIPEAADAAAFADGLPEAAAELIRLVEARGFGCERLDRFAFYAAAGRAYGIVRSGESQVYGNLILTKGVVSPP